MRLAALFSGGKDSTYSVFRAIRAGHTVECLITLEPDSAESMLLHAPAIHLTALQARSMGIPHLYERAGKAEYDTLVRVIRRAKLDYRIQGLVQGGIRSKYQRNMFGRVCAELGLELISPVWGEDSRHYMESLLSDGFRFVITGVSAGGLDDSWLGCELDDASLSRLVELSERFGFDVAFEGGEAETFVLDCPLFSHPVEMPHSRKVWDGYRGTLEIACSEPKPTYD